MGEAVPMEQQDVIEALARAKYEHRRQTPWGVYSAMPPWEEESETLHDEIRDEVRATLKALDAAGYAVLSKETGAPLEV
jgi:hypothetical protein